MNFRKIEYSQLNARQQENYNFHKVSAVLANYGFTSLRLTDDFQGADFLAVHVNGDDILKVQLKGRFGVWKKYLRKDIWVAFQDAGDWYLYPHDKAVAFLENKGSALTSESWAANGEYHFPVLPKSCKQFLGEYRLN